MTHQSDHPPDDPTGDHAATNDGVDDVMPPGDDWVGRDYLEQFTDRSVLSRRRGDRPRSRWRRD